MSNNYINDYIEFQKIVNDYYDKAIKTASKRCGISKEEADLILFFYNNPEFTCVSDAEKYCGFSKESTLNVITRLCEHKLLVINEDENTQIKRIEITGKGGIIGKSLSEVQRKISNRMMDNFTSEEIELIKKFYNKIINNLK